MWWNSKRAIKIEKSVRQNDKVVVFIEAVTPVAVMLVFVYAMHTILDKCRESDEFVQNTDSSGCCACNEIQNAILPQ